MVDMAIADGVATSAMAVRRCGMQVAGRYLTA